MAKAEHALGQEATLRTQSIFLKDTQLEVELWDVRMTEENFHRMMLDMEGI